MAIENQNPGLGTGDGSYYDGQLNHGPYRVSYVGTAGGALDRQNKLIARPEGTIAVNNFNGQGQCCCEEPVYCLVCQDGVIVDPNTQIITKRLGCKYSMHTRLSFSFALTCKYPDGTIRQITGIRTALKVKRYYIPGGSGTDDPATGTTWVGGNSQNIGNSGSADPNNPGYYFVKKVCSAAYRYSDVHDLNWWWINDVCDSPLGNGPLGDKRFIKTTLKLTPYGPHCMGFKLANIWQNLGRHYVTPGTPADYSHDSTDNFLDAGGLGTVQDYYLQNTAYNTTAYQYDNVHILSVDSFECVVTDNECDSYQQCGDYNKDEFCDTLHISLNGISFTDSAGAVHSISGSFGGLSANPDSITPQWSWVRAYDYYQPTGSGGGTTAPNRWNDYTVISANVIPSNSPTSCRWLLEMSFTTSGGNSNGRTFNYISTTEDIAGTYGDANVIGNLISKSGDTYTYHPSIYPYTGNAIESVTLPHPLVDCNTNIPPYTPFPNQPALASVSKPAKSGPSKAEALAARSRKVKGCGCK